MDEAALLVLSDAKKESYDKMHDENSSKDANNVKKDDGGNVVADNKSVVNAMKMRSNAALKAAQRKAMTR